MPNDKRTSSKTQPNDDLPPAQSDFLTTCREIGQRFRQKNAYLHSARRINRIIDKYMDDAFRDLDY